MAQRTSSRRGHIAGDETRLINSGGAAGAGEHVDRIAPGPEACVLSAYEERNRLEAKQRAVSSLSDWVLGIQLNEIVRAAVFAAPTIGSTASIILLVVGFKPGAWRPSTSQSATSANRSRQR